MTVGKVHLTKRYARYRVREPSRFQKDSFRTLDVGRKGHTKIIAGRLKGKSKLTAQSVLISKADYEKGYRVKMKKGKPVIYNPKFERFLK